jgi:hypothetical protein
MAKTCKFYLKFVKSEKAKSIFYPIFSDFGKIVDLLRFPGLACLSLYDQHVDEDEYGALVE